LGRARRKVKPDEGAGRGGQYPGGGHTGRGCRGRSRLAGLTGTSTKASLSDSAVHLRLPWWARRARRCQGREPSSWEGRGAASRRARAGSAGALHAWQGQAARQPRSRRV